MNNYQQNLKEEKSYLENITAFIKEQLTLETEKLARRKSELIATRKDMWEDTSIDMNQYFSSEVDQPVSYASSLMQVQQYKKCLSSPYFGRFDFREEGYHHSEKIYLGLTTLIDPQTDAVYVYDWRAPICSIFYQYELGQATYTAPIGEIGGEVCLKRQYKIQASQLKYFFDSSIVIKDQILQEILSHNTSVKMKTIVETIQKEQDSIIRDIDNELLIVQGVAGSGKTSIALHRVAFLLYDGLRSTLQSNNLLILSPNELFTSYISDVLPELGEENVEQKTFGEIVTGALAERFQVEAREEQLEALIELQHERGGRIRRQSVGFKGSSIFKQLLDRLLWHYEHRLIPFGDVYYAGRVIENKHRLKCRLLNDKSGLPLAKRLQRLENSIWDKLHSLRSQRLAKIERIVQRSEGHDLEIKSFSRLLSIKESKTLRQYLQKFTKVDYWQVYTRLFNDPKLFFTLAQGLELPAGIEEIIAATEQSLQAGKIPFEDCAPLLYLKFKIEGSELFPDIKQVVIDEAQDYYPIQYEIFKLLFPEAKYTVLGDIQQTLEKKADVTLYEEIKTIFNKPKTTKLFLNKSYRSSYEINQFTKGLLDVPQDYLSFERYEEEPRVVYQETRHLLDQKIIRDIATCQDMGYQTVAIICKTFREAEEIYTRLEGQVGVRLLRREEGKVEKGVMIIPAYLAKGLEFDVVLVYGVNQENYTTEFDRKLLYISCTRAQHRLMLYYWGEKSHFLP